MQLYCQAVKLLKGLHHDSCLFVPAWPTQLSAAQVLESKLLLARDLLKEEPVNTELLKEVTEAPSLATHSISPSVLPSFFHMSRLLSR